MDLMTNNNQLIQILTNISQINRICNLTSKFLNIVEIMWCNLKKKKLY